MTITAPRIGELFAGYGGLGMGVQAVLGGSVAWFSEFDEAPSKILAHHWPAIPNLGDITKVDWSTVEPVDILTGGFPCQDVSLAGARRGLKDGTRSGLWSYFAEAIGALKPGLVVIENVRGLLSAEAGGSVEPDPWGVGNGATRPVINALGAVLGDLANLGYDAEWCGVRAADAGAPHGRFRVFIVAHPRSDESERRGTVRHLGGTPFEGEGNREERQRVRDTVSDSSATAADTYDSGRSEHRGGIPVRAEQPPAEHPSDDIAWGVYEPAIRRWENVLGHRAPNPTQPSDKALAARAKRLAGLDKRPVGMRGSLRLVHQLSPQFVEWMMGLTPGHVTDPAIGLTRNQQLKALGNGVVPQQAAMALRMLLGAE